MSKDFIVFDLSGLNSIPSQESLLESVHSFVGNGEEVPIEMATEKINEVLCWATQQYGSSVDSDAHWGAWPPSLLAEGHHCTFNLCLSADSINFMMDLSDQCKRLGLVMI